jgi:hypothetical protein
MESCGKNLFSMQSKLGTEKFSFTNSERNDRFLTAMKNFLEERKMMTGFHLYKDGIKSLWR